MNTAMNRGMDHVRDLLTAAADTVGWQIDLDQLPVTCAQVPTGVLTLIEASAAHLAALAGQGMLDEAAESIRTVMDGADTRDVDWEVRLLAAVLPKKGSSSTSWNAPPAARWTSTWNPTCPNRNSSSSATPPWPRRFLRSATCWTIEPSS